jgi:hypothetical protein
MLANLGSAAHRVVVRSWPSPRVDVVVLDESTIPAAAADPDFSLLPGVELDGSSFEVELSPLSVLFVRPATAQRQVRA